MSTNNQRSLTLALIAAVFSLGIALFLARDACASSDYTLTMQTLSLAPNAGGQTAYSARLLSSDFEYGVFSNTYLLAGNYPLTGAVMNYHMPLCEKDCWWQFFAQAGGGISTGGPLAEITWGMILPLVPLWLPTKAPKYYPALRLDITSQFIFIRNRALIWNYPMWIGLSLPI